MPAFYSGESNRYFWRAGTVAVIAMILILTIAFLSSALEKWAADRVAEHNAMLREFGCTQEQLYYLPEGNRVSIAGQPIWRCAGKLVDGQLANVLVQEQMKGNRSRWEALKAAK
ncbi:MAG: hypothetical protein WAT81_05525 [Candidatus Moraniibacteriota bacterium]